MRRDDIVDGYLLVHQGKTEKKLRIQVENDGAPNSLGALIERISLGNAEFLSPFLVINRRGQRVSWPMLRNRWDTAREEAAAKAAEAGEQELAVRIRQCQFRDIRPKAASKIRNLSDASLPLGHSPEASPMRVYRRAGAIAKPSK